MYSVVTLFSVATDVCRRSLSFIAKTLSWMKDIPGNCDWGGIHRLFVVDKATVTVKE